MYKAILSFFLLVAVTSTSSAEALTLSAPDKNQVAHRESGLADPCYSYANESKHQCLKKQVAISVAELEASMLKVRKMMAQWDKGPHRKLAEVNFEKTGREFERYKRTQCEYFASMRYGLGDQDEVGIARLECVLHLNAQRTRDFTALTATIIM